MKKRIVINGFGRIGRTFLRNVLTDAAAREQLEIVAINVGPGSVDMVAHIFKYDSIMGTYAGDVALHNNQLIIDGYALDVIAEKNPELAPWKRMKVDWVVESSGHFSTRQGATKHLDAGARNVLITAPASEDDVTIVPGVNAAAYKKGVHRIVSLGSCTTNAVAPTLKIINDGCGIEYAMMSTVHAYTNTQALLDGETDGDPRRSRAAALNMVPSTTGATKVVMRVLPELTGKVTGCSVRVPVPNVSLIDLTFTTSKPITAAQINDLFAVAAAGPLKGIVALSYEPLVSTDYCGNSHSVIIDAALTQVVGTMGKVFGWYDNEWAYSARLKDFLSQIAE